MGLILWLVVIALIVWIISRNRRGPGGRRGGSDDLADDAVAILDELHH